MVIDDGPNYLELINRVVKNVNTKDISIIIISAFAHDEERKEGLKSGDNTYMTQPFDTEKLLNRLAFYTKK